MTVEDRWAALLSLEALIAAAAAVAYSNSKRPE